MGEVSGNWGDPSPFRPAPGGEKTAFVGTASVETSADKAVSVPVTVRGIAGEGIISYEFDLRYDPAVIQPQANPIDLAGTISSGLASVFNASEPGLLRVAVYGAMPIEADGVLVNLRFESVGAADSASPLVFERIAFNDGETVTAMTAAGEVKLAAATGDRAEIEGRLLDATGHGVGNARITLTDALGNSRVAVSNSFGVYRIGALEIGQTYTLSVQSRSFAFAPMTVSVTGQKLSVDLIAGQ